MSACLYGLHAGVDGAQEKRCQKNDSQDADSDSVPRKRPRVLGDHRDTGDLSLTTTWNRADHSEALAEAVEAEMSANGEWIDLAHHTWSGRTANIGSHDYLKILYPHVRDADCFLEELTHTYHVRGCKYDCSVSSVWGVFFPKFDAGIAKRMLLKADERGLVNIESSLYWLYMHLMFSDRLEPDSTKFWAKIGDVLEAAEKLCVASGAGTFDKDIACQSLRHLAHSAQVRKPSGASCYFLVLCAGYSASDIQEVWQMHGNLESLKGTLLHKQAELFMQELALFQVEAGRKHVPLGDLLANEIVIRRARAAATVHASMSHVAAHVSSEIWDHPVTRRYFRGALLEGQGLEFRKLEAWFHAHPTFSPYRSEWSIYDENARVAGQIDSLWFDETRNGVIIMADWKRVRKSLSPDVLIQEEQAFGKYGLRECVFAALYPGPCADMFDCAYNHYLVQQHLYAYILRLHYGVDVGLMMLVQCHPEVGERVDSFHEVGLPECPVLARLVMDAFLQGWWRLLECNHDGTEAVPAPTRSPNSRRPRSRSKERDADQPQGGRTGHPE